MLGIPTYGRSYTLFNEESSEIGAPADGPGNLSQTLSFWQVFNSLESLVQLGVKNYKMLSISLREKLRAICTIFKLARCSKTV